MKRKICVITGSRADYGILYPVLKEMQHSPKLSVSLIVTCMHLMKDFGGTIRDIKKDRIPIGKIIDISYTNDSSEAVSDAIGSALRQFSHVFHSLKPSVILLLGDRGEMLAAAIAANYLNIPVAHIHGGEVSGHIDGLFRHAITKLSHIHFPATAMSRSRIEKLGEERKRIFLSGAPALDRIRTERLTRKQVLIKKYQIDSTKDLALCVQHPLNTEADRAYYQMKTTLNAITALKLQTVIIYPNADAGGRAMVRAIKRVRSKPFLRIFPSIPHEDYLGLMKIANVLIGNSSSGIIEAPSFGLPVVNIGERQKGRERARNVIDVPCRTQDIVAAIHKAVDDKQFIRSIAHIKNPYGSGHASTLIASVLETIPINRTLYEKKLAY